MIQLLGLFISMVMAAGTESPRFRMHMASEPTSIAPATQKTSANGYLLGQLACPLLKWDNEKAQPWGAHCEFVGPLKVSCRIQSSLKFDDGSPVTAEHYLNAFRTFLDPKQPSPRAEILAPVRNAMAYAQGKKSATDLGIKVQKNQLIFELEKPDPDFLLTLTNPSLTALKNTDVVKPNDFAKYISCGPYRFDSWEPGRKIVLAPNPHFPFGHAKRPVVEIVFINEDSVALQSYQKGDLDFLRRLPTLFLSRWEGKPDLHKIDQVRFDYLSLNSRQGKANPDLAKALAQSIDYEAWRKLYSAKPRPGCSGLPERWTQGTLCWEFDLKAAKEALARFQKNPTPIPKLVYSKQGGDDHDRTMQFLQAQWKKNLGLDVQIEARENKVFLGDLRGGKIGFFRKGLSPERPSCEAVLSTFQKDHPENNVNFSDPDFEKLLTDLANPKTKDRSALCRRGVQLLLDRAFLIPTGPIYFSILVKPRWQGWFLNELNQLDLSDLHDGT